MKKLKMTPLMLICIALGTVACQNKPPSDRPTTSHSRLEKALFTATSSTIKEVKEVTEASSNNIIEETVTIDDKVATTGNATLSSSVRTNTDKIRDLADLIRSKSDKLDEALASIVTLRKEASESTKALARKDKTIQTLKDSQANTKEQHAMTVLLISGSILTAVSFALLFSGGIVAGVWAKGGASIGVALVAASLFIKAILLYWVYLAGFAGIIVLGFIVWNIYEFVKHRRHLGASVSIIDMFDDDEQEDEKIIPEFRKRVLELKNDKHMRPIMKREKERHIRSQEKKSRR